MPTSKSIGIAVSPWRIITFALLGAWSIPGHAEGKADDKGQQDQGCEGRTTGFTSDVKCYVTAPLRWDSQDWIYFGSAVAAVGIAHHYDTDVRDHFTSGSNSSSSDSSSTDVEDAIPAAGIFAATLAVCHRDP